MRRLSKKPLTKRVPMNKYDAYDPAPFNELQSSFVGATDMGDHFTNITLAKWVREGLDIHYDSTKVFATRREWESKHATIFHDRKLHIFGAGEGSLYLYGDDQLHVVVAFSSNAASIGAYGSLEAVKWFKRRVESNYDLVTSYIDWIYSRDGHSVTIPLNATRLPHSEMYPFLGDRSLEEYYDAFMKSPSAILLLIGPPGTGKTSFIRGLLHHTQASATVTYDPEILDQDHVFASFIEGENELMVLEDSDSFLRKRNEGNTMMHRFLNVGDGLVTAQGKKMIFSTNLPSISEIDPALVRPGRCFDIIEFGPLNEQQVQQVAAAIGIAAPAVPEKGMTLAEMFNGAQKTTTKLRKVGFL